MSGQEKCCRCSGKRRLVRTPKSIRLDVPTHIVPCPVCVDGICPSCAGAGTIYGVQRRFLRSDKITASPCGLCNGSGMQPRAGRGRFSNRNVRRNAPGSQATT